MRCRRPPTAETSSAERSSPDFRWWGATGLGLVALLVLVGFWDPVAHGGPVLCLFRRATGLACPACGLTRATALAAHGRFLDAVRLHPALPLVALEALAAWLAWGWGLRTGRKPLERWAMPILLATALLLIALWLVRWALGTLPT